VERGKAGVPFKAKREEVKASIMELIHALGCWTEESIYTERDKLMLIKCPTQPDHPPYLRTPRNIKRYGARCPECDLPSGWPVGHSKIYQNVLKVILELDLDIKQEVRLEDKGNSLRLDIYIRPCPRFPRGLGIEVDGGQHFDERYHKYADQVARDIRKDGLFRDKATVIKSAPSLLRLNDKNCTEEKALHYILECGKVDAASKSPRIYAPSFYKELKRRYVILPSNSGSSSSSSSSS